MKKRITMFLLVMFSIAIFLTGCGPSTTTPGTSGATSPDGMVAVLVMGPAPAARDLSVDRGTYVPLSGVLVSLLGTDFNSLTDINGYATIDNVPAGTYTATIGKDGYLGYSGTITVGGGATTQVGPATGVDLPASTAPYILNVDPLSAAVGTSITITGCNFGASLSKGGSSSTVTFNGIIATATSWSSTQIVCTVPAGSTTGNLVVTVGGVASNSITFTVSGAGAPVINNLSISSAPVGTSVAINGSNFGSTQGSSTVTFYNGKTATIVSPSDWSDSTIFTTVPTGATTGNIVVTVNGVASNGMPFTVTASTPQILSLSMVSGSVGVPVTINGNNFGATKGASTVTFNGTLAVIVNPSDWSDTTISTTVPAGADTGNIVVTVGGVPSNGMSFGVLAWRVMQTVPVEVSTETFNAVWGKSDGSNVYAVGTGYKIISYNPVNGIWTEQASGLDPTGAFRGVWGTSDGTKVFAAGDAGNIRQKISGGAWSNSTSDTAIKLNGIWGWTSGETTYAFAVGDADGGAATLRYYAGGSPWQNRVSTATVNLLAIWGKGDGSLAYAVGASDGANGTVRKYTGAWDPVAAGAPNDNLLGVWGSGTNNIFVICQNGGRIGRYTGAWNWDWNPAVPGVTGLKGIWGSSSSDVYVVGNSGTILHYDGINWSQSTSPTVQNLMGVWGTSSTNVYAVGANGTILHYGTE